MKETILELATTLRHELHRHPELSMREQWTKQHLMAFLRQHTELEIVDRDHWFYAVYRSGNSAPAIAFRADYDAIAMDEGLELPYASEVPGVSHKCGHDGHSATLAALALDVSQQGAPRDVYFIFQPGEETGQGGEACGVFLSETPRISEVYATHNMPGLPLGAVALRNGTIWCASRGVALEFTGANAHASQPETGKNPVFAMAAVLDALPGIEAPDRYKGLVLCTVVHMAAGEKAFGIAAGKGRLWVTCRGQFEDEMEAAIAELEAVAAQQAARYGLELAVSYHECFPQTFNHKKNVDKVCAVCHKSGVQLIEMDKPMRSSEDFGYFLKACDGAMFLLGAGDIPAIHTTGYDFPDALIEHGVNIFRALIEA